jgi:hypothetical protein
MFNPARKKRRLKINKLVLKNSPEKFNYLYRITKKSLMDKPWKHDPKLPFLLKSR